MAAVRERARSQSLATTTSEASCSSEVDDSSEASSTTDSSSYRNDRGMTNGGGGGGGFLGVPSVSTTVTIKLSPSRAVFDTNVFATVCPNAVKKPVPATTSLAPASPVPFKPATNTTTTKSSIAVNAPKVLAVPASKQIVQPTKPQFKPQPVTQTTTNNNKFTSSVKPPPTTVVAKAVAAAPAKLTKRQSTEEESSDPLDSDLSDADVEEIEDEEEGEETDEEEVEEEGEEEESGDEAESEDEVVQADSGKIGGNVVRPRKEYELDDFQMIKTIGESQYYMGLRSHVGNPAQLSLITCFLLLFHSAPLLLMMTRSANRICGGEGFATGQLIQCDKSALISALNVGQIKKNSDDHIIISLDLPT